MLILLYLMQSKYIKMNLQMIVRIIGLYVLEFFCVALYTVYLFNHNKMFQVASTYNTNVVYQIWNFSFILFLSYAVNSFTNRHNIS